ncbi:MAG: hypothetical protein OXE73_09530 [Gammaproteobacteria bacterium]|nr:hypothetical protein [Gammaproteobacteria bacterium]
MSQPEWDVRQLTVTLAQYAKSQAIWCEGLAGFHERKRGLHEQQAVSHEDQATFYEHQGGARHEGHTRFHREQAESHRKQADLCRRISRYLKKGQGKLWTTMQEYFDYRVPPHTVPGVPRELTPEEVAGETESPSKGARPK